MRNDRRLDDLARRAAWRDGGVPEQALIEELATLRRILQAEERRGHDNRAVLGGLSAFLARWRQRVERASLPDHLHRSATAVLDHLAAYDDGTPAERQRASGTALAALDQLVQQLQRADAPSPARPAPAGSAAPPHPGRAGTIASPPSGAESSRQPTLARTTASPTRRRSTGPLPSLDEPVTRLPGVGPHRARLLERLGLRRVRDLLDHVPYRYADYPPPVPASDLFFARVASFVGTVERIDVTSTARGLKKIVATLRDATGSVGAVWFRSGYGGVRISPGQRVALSGELHVYGRQVVFQDPDWEPADAPPTHTRRLVPFYSLTGNLSQTWLREMVRRVVDRWAPTLPDPLPESLRAELDLPPRSWALEQIHFPDDADALERARRRLAFDELLLVQLTALRRREAWQRAEGLALPSQAEVLAAFRAGLPFTLTRAQERVLGEICADLARPRPMARLLQGEVGSGKTAVAAAALLVAVANGAQGALMAPTEILAEQHFRSITTLYERAGASLAAALGRPPRVALLTGSTPRGERRTLLRAVASGAVDILIGTHALIQEDVEFARLALAVVDEQHRFGVRQRLSLRAKGTNPHLLVMTATPIPRTLALTLYGDLDLSTIDELPPGRQRIRTLLLRSAERHLAYEHIRREVAKGRQAFVICPLVEESPHLEARAAVEEYERLRHGELAGLRLGLLHGRMRPAEKDEVMRAFRAGQFDVLVSTAVVEVGVDVPNATAMLIEGAERFGLAQLHQFRGRVGRGPYPSACLLVTDSETPEAVERLATMERVDNGLALAEEDLRLRGPGDLVGVRQSGLPDLRFARLTETDLVEQARRGAARLLAADPDLSHPDHRALRAALELFWERIAEPN